MITAPRAPRREFSDELKQDIVNFSIEHGATAACKHFDVAHGTLGRWRRIAGIAPVRRTVQVSTIPVAKIRRGFELLDEDVPKKEVARQLEIDKSHVIRWVKDERFREATMEYNPLFNYDINDLLDRALVAHHLCAQEAGPDRIELRLELLAAAIDYEEAA